MVKYYSAVAIACLACVWSLLFVVSQATGPAPVDTSKEKDFQSALTQRSQFNDGDFVLKFTPPAAATPNPAGQLIAASIDQVPLLGVIPERGVAQVLVTLESCAINQPHHHPRGTETAFVLEGTIFFGLQEENGGRFISNNVTAGQSMVLPQGLMHFVQNLGCEPVKFLASFDNRDFGVQTTASNLFKFPDTTLRATFGLENAEDFRKVQEAANAQANPSQDPACLKACHAGGRKLK